MKPYYFKKHKEADLEDYYYIDEGEILPALGGEFSPDFQKYYNFVTRYINYLNWYNTHTSPLNGDTSYAELRGWITGFMAASNIEEIAEKDSYCLRKGNKLLFKFDKIPLSHAEIETRKDNAKTWRALLGD